MARTLREVSEEEFERVAAQAERKESTAAKDAGGSIFLLAIALGLIWIMGVGIGAHVLFGPERLFALNALEAGALAATAFLPALMVWIAGATGREGARARAEARRLADAANQLLAPAPGAEIATRRLALAVRSEIAALDKALEQTLSRLKEVEGQISKQSSAVDQMSAQAREGAGHMIMGMEREREELMRISQDLTSQANSIGSTIARHTQSIAQAARMAEQEVKAADEALDARLSSFGAAAALITDRTRAVDSAAKASADSALKLENALSGALDVLAKATHLTDAARQSATAATLAANSSATSAHANTAQAVEDAKRAAELIRNQAATVDKEATSALERLRDAAQAARGAARDVRGAVEQAPQQPAPPPPQQPQAERTQNLFGASPAAPRSMQPAPRPAPQTAPRSAPPNGGGAWTWRDLISSMDEEDAEAHADMPAPEPRREPRERMREPGREPAQARESNDPIARLQRAVTEPRPTSAHPIPAAAAIERAGVRINEAFSRGALDRIAQRARNGTQARRRAVRDAAPDAVNALADLLDRDANARQDAAHFLKSDGARIAELLARGRATMSADATRVFLLVDAASG